LKLGLQTSMLYIIKTKQQKQQNLSQILIAFLFVHESVISNSQKIIRV